MAALADELAEALMDAFDALAGAFEALAGELAEALAGEFEVLADVARGGRNGIGPGPFVVMVQSPRVRASPLPWPS